LNNIESGYSVSWPGHFHHLICTACGKVVAFEGCELEHMLDNLKRQTRFTIDGHLLEIYGHCSDCSGFSAS
jgi:Fur family ferric uptake transcriptional regulator